MNRRERVRAALEGRTTDRLPVACWQHFAYADGDAQAQIDSLTRYQQQFEYDFIKLMFRSNFLSCDWGVVNGDYDDVLGFLLTERYAVRETSDWRKLQVLDPKKGMLGEMLQVTRGVRAMVGGDIYLLATAFSPIMAASQLSGRPQLIDDMEHHPDQVEAALDAITETLIGFVRACCAAGADGLFFADETAGEGRLTREQYGAFGHPYNRRFLEAIAGLSDFTMLHICGRNVYFDEFLDYPVEACNWDHTLGNPSLAEARALTDKCLIGGMDKMGALWKGSPQDVATEARSAVAAAGRGGLILAPGCGVPTSCPDANLLALRRVCDGL